MDDAIDSGQPVAPATSHSFPPKPIAPVCSTPYFSGCPRILAPPAEGSPRMSPASCRELPSIPVLTPSNCLRIPSLPFTGRVGRGPAWESHLFFLLSLLAALRHYGVLGIISEPQLRAVLQLRQHRILLTHFVGLGIKPVVLALQRHYQSSCTTARTPILFILKDTKN